MNINILQKIFAWMVAGICAGATIFAADAAPAAKPAPAPEVPANPFGPKPATSADSTTATSTPTMTSIASVGAESFVPAVREMLLQRFDKNKDGKLDNTELAEAYALFIGGGGARAGASEGATAYANGPLFGLRGLILRHFGKPPNETLDAAEIAELHTFLFGAKTETPKPGADLDSLRQQIVKQFDKKGTGHLDEAELAAAKAFLQQMLADLDKYGSEKAAVPKIASPPPANTANSPAGTTPPK